LSDNPYMPVRPVHPWVAAATAGPRFGVGLGPQTLPDCIGFVQLAEQLGFDSYWANDHPTRTADPWTVLTALAATTKKIRLGSLVSCVYYRNPVALARQAADVDRLSEGRLVLGLGIGDDAREFGQLGLPFPPPAQRHEALAESIEVITRLWSDPPVTYRGKHFQINNAELAGPGPVQRPHVPILIGGGGERTTLKQVARYADVSNFGEHEWVGRATTGDDVTRKFRALRAHCSTLGRPFSSILRSHVAIFLVLAETQIALDRKVDVLARHGDISRYGAVAFSDGTDLAPTLPDDLRASLIACTPRQLVDRYRSLMALGMQYFIALVYGDDLETLHLLSQAVIPELKEPRSQAVAEG
jgi:alkanesulfonate monooxygenase SsuD/methylene tetrahydromethanopterin reductase-like flavin-dependent oxidoreductase (luciferase family)